MHKLPPAQEIFDLVTTHLFTQNRRAEEYDDGCFYRLAGLRCAVGVLIPDDLYCPAFEGKTVGTLIEELFLLGLADWREHGLLLSNLQKIHDNCPTLSDKTFNRIELERRLRACAERFSLEYRR